MVDWILENWTNIFTVFGFVGAGCSAVVKVLGGCKWASVLVKLCDHASIYNTPENKAILEKYSKKNK